MTLSPANRIQSNSGLVTGASSFTATLPNPTTDSGTLLLFIGTAGTGVISIQSNAGFDPPWFQDGAQAGKWFAWRRDNQPAGETSWAITASTSANYQWRVEEWGGLATAGQPDAVSDIKTNSGTLVCSTGDVVGGGSPAAAIADVDDFAALAVFRPGAGVGPAAWPTVRNYSSGWSEVTFLSQGDGSGVNDYALILAEAYPGAAGTVICTLTYDNSGGGSPPNIAAGWAVCYQPAAPPPALGVLASL